MPVAAITYTAMPLMIHAAIGGTHAKSTVSG